MLNVIRSIFKVEDLRNRVLFTLLILVFFRAGTHIPIPGIDREALGELFNSQIGNVLSFFNTFSGGALRNLSIFALGIIPYISASIIMQIMTAVVPSLEKLSQEGDEGRRKISQYTRYLTMVLSLIQGFGIVSGISNITTPSGQEIVVTNLSYNYFLVSSLITLTAGTNCCPKDCTQGVLTKAVSEEGKANMKEAKISGITPDTLTFKGKKEDCPP